MSNHKKNKILKLIADDQLLKAADIMVNYALEENPKYLSEIILISRNIKSIKKENLYGRNSHEFIKRLKNEESLKMIQLIIEESFFSPSKDNQD